MPRLVFGGVMETLKHARGGRSTSAAWLTLAATVAGALIWQFVDIHRQLAELHTQVRIHEKALFSQGDRIDRMSDYQADDDQARKSQSGETTASSISISTP